MLKLANLNTNVFLYSYYNFIFYKYYVEIKKAYFSYS